MLEYPLWKKIWLWGLTLVFAAAAVPSLVTADGLDWPDFLPDPEINLGLDLAGGSHLLLEADPADVSKRKFEQLEEAVERELGNATPEIEYDDMSRADGRLSFLLETPADIDRARAALESVIQGTGLTRLYDFEVVDTQRIVLTPTSSGIDEAVDTAMEAATTVVRKRIDALGTREPTIIRQGDNRIVVQVPGLDDPEALKEQLGQTAQLEFKLVAPSQQSEMTLETAQENLVPGTEIVPMEASEGETPLVMMVNRLGGLSGDNLTRAKAGVDPQNNRDVVNIQFDTQGGQKFAQLSTQNVGKRFAIILDGEIISAPVFNEPILGGSAQISGNFTAETANQLAISLESGALPVPLTVVEQRSVGPDLGADSIRRGLIAMLIGSLAVIALMVATYGRFGVYATVALVFNVLILLGLMAIGNFTLTLPGIAGFVLTVGAAVDANVLINERIREERKRGRRVVAAVENGYKEASRAIYDANITNFIAGVLLFWFGSGPVRGFAVVLVIGLITTIFTALSLTRMWAAGWLRDKRPADINI